MIHQKLPLPQGADKQAFIRYYLDKARANLREGKVCLDQKLVGATIGASYHVLYQAANAVMMAVGWPGSDPQRKNWHHETVYKAWPDLLARIEELGIETDYDAPEARPAGNRADVSEEAAE